MTECDPATNPRRNHIIERLSRASCGALLAHAHATRIEQGAVLCEAGADATQIYFPHDSVISLVQHFADGTQVETATVGCEGLAPLGPVIGPRDDCALQHRVQIGGWATRISRARLAALIVRYGDLRQCVMRYGAGFSNSALISVSCSRVHFVEQRLARCLLLTDDRTSKELLPLTQEALAIMVGVQRPTVTLAARDLLRRGLIEYQRGQVRIVDRPGLERAACECYRLSVEQLPATC